MAAYGSAPWLARLEQLCDALPQVPGSTGSIQVMVNGAPDEGGAFHLSFADGRLVESDAGVDETVDTTVTLPYALCLELLDGTVTANTAYMRGDLKTNGKTGPLLRLLALARSEPFAAIRAALAAETDR